MNFVQRQAIRAGCSMISPMILEVLPEFAKWLSSSKMHLVTSSDESEPIIAIFERKERLIISLVILDTQDKITRQLINLDLGVLITNLSKILTWFFTIKEQDRIPSLAEVMDFYSTLTDQSNA